MAQVEFIVQNSYSLYHATCTLSTVLTSLSHTAKSIHLGRTLLCVEVFFFMDAILHSCRGLISIARCIYMDSLRFKNI